ncbi:2-C-methyl-D-erythritol 4-phosphate cytidylyltransferase [Nocardioides jiangxiensis]|uniref:2-C-methyl-D-erythritol 4-phosphate cytidylyltransferase n=1 Tax=Nocardioides jiangxiensis TaxID=3064524 RepID=A0ABT9B144_9ACTN|nr:2-C-methyl-D-erythritol 4-phosphate cytidylyltransferase [Nocardioides sp. WY-20]MDO7868554.1 2-C-methyl-D-erythritol 4-phosphate cytidylyltransferase [Nocardioides sp. WY-20]
MESARRSVAVLLAGGIGARAGLGMPKQFAELRGRTILGHALAALHDHPGVEGVLVVMAPGYVDAARVVTAGHPRVLDVIEGGAERSDSTVAALRWLADHALAGADLLVHDAARPLVSARIISDCLAALATHQAVGVAVRSSDTILRADATGRVVDVPPRGELWRAQTPQGFRAGVLQRAYDVALADPAFVATDDCSVVLRYLPDVPVQVVEGEDRNMKVTGPDDLAIAERLLGLG